MINIQKSKTHNKASILLAGIALAAGFYLLSIFWRVSVAEQKLFGRSYLIPMALHTRQYTEEPVASSFGTMTYSYQRQGKKIRVYKQLINGFQHTYGSALTAYELGDTSSDFLFRINEYLESYLTNDGNSSYHYLDTKKDLANNAIGRQIGVDARKRHLVGRAAKNFILSRILTEIESGKVINHYLDRRVQTLPSPEESGCPGLRKLPAIQAQQVHSAHVICCA